MHDARFFSATFAAALAALLGLGPAAAASLERGPQDYRVTPESAAAMPAWLVRYKLRRLGYRAIARVEAVAEGFAVLAQDRWGRRVKLLMDSSTCELIPRGGYGLAHLVAAEVAGHLAGLGYQCLAPATHCCGHYQVLAREAGGVPCRLNVDPLSGAVWHERA
ncbi:MAG: hypothetical protein ACHQF3_05795 [Alphaproteobacteria bacterium]